MGKQQRHVDYTDERTRSSLTAVKFANACGLMVFFNLTLDLKIHNIFKW
jgi:hypothetical protein